MGLADFLATAGQGKTLGHVAEAFGGRTIQQQAVDDFIKNQLPALADQIHKAGTKEDVAKAGQSLITSGLKAGINPQGLDKLMEMTIQPALRNMQAGELEKLGAEYRAQPAQPAESRPPGTEGPLTQSGNFIDPKAATPEKPLDLNFAMRLGQATGAKTDDYRQLLTTPADIAGKLASNKKTQGEIDREQAKESAVQGLSNTPQAPGQPSPQATARINPAGIMQFLPQREDSQSKQDYQNQSLNLKQLGLENNLSLANQRIGLGEERNQILREKAERDKQKADQQLNTETTADQAYGSLDREIDLKAIARDAHAQGKTSSSDIKALAAQRGLEVEGNPQLTVSGGAFGYGGTPSLTGNFELRKKPRVTTKAKTEAGQGRYSQGVPSGSAPVPRTSEAGGAGSGGSSGNKPQRMKFDAQGNLVK